MGNKIIIALDGISGKKALGIAKILKGMVWGFKVNDLLFEDPKIIGKLKKYGKVFADAKLYDIPNTVANSVAKLSRVGADIITVHASGGIEMMQMAKLNAGRAKIIAVTALTSNQVNSKDVIPLARDAIKAKLDGIVCSGQDIQYIKRIPESKSLLKVIPGIRPLWYKNRDDQKRIVTPREAIKLGTDYLVIGRPILKSKNLTESIQKLKAELK